MLAIQQELVPAPELQERASNPIVQFIANALAALGDLL
jgi:hypothetical protein